MDDERISEAPAWIADSAHAWLRVPLACVEASGYEPTAYSYRDATYAYLEEDCDAPAYLKHCGIWDGVGMASFPHFSDVRYTDGHDRVRRLPQWGGDSKMYRAILAS